MLVEKVDKKIDGSLILKTQESLNLKTSIFKKNKQAYNGFGTYKLKSIWYFKIILFELFIVIKKYIQRTKIFFIISFNYLCVNNER